MVDVEAMKELYTEVVESSIHDGYAAIFPDGKFAVSARIYSGAKIRPDIELLMEEDTFIGTNATILVPKLVMKKGSQINAGAILFGKQPIYLDENVVVGYNAVLGTSTDMPQGKHMNDASSEEERAIMAMPLHIWHDAFIGSNAVLMPGAEIGSRAVIGAESYIDKNVPADTIVYPKMKYVIKKR